MREALRAAKLFRVDRPVDPDLGVTRFLSDWQRRTGDEPCFLFTDITGSPLPLAMNLPTRAALLAEMGLADAPDPIAQLADRLATPAPPVFAPSLATRDIASLADLPLLRHQPGDVGKYLTAFVGALADGERGGTNLGFYRGLVAGPREIVLFMDPRTDAHRIVTAGLAHAPRVPITLFNGGPLSVYLAAAAKLPATIDSFDAAARFAGQDLVLAGGDYPSAPAEARIVIEGHVTRERRTEAPFGEFKGYYSDATDSPVVVVDRIRVRDDAICLGLFCGKTSGLTLMALQNEILLFDHLRSAGFAVDSVRYPLDGFGEYLAVVESAAPSQAMVAAALDFDPRAKLVVVGHPGIDVLKEAIVYPAEVERRPYIRRGKQEGHRIGMLCDRRGDYRWTEL
ncbi:UbiD family decarboxylase [Sphingomonas sp. R86521]|uniref:UbiD family decarboxylase n=1 Tax=Sphingomonas sp. R86521 TaxID=3093860 RepID=UPI0036D3FAA2